MKKAIIFFVLILLAAVPALAENVQAAGPVDDDAQPSLAGYVIVLHTGGTFARADDALDFARVAEAKTRFEAEGAAVLLLDAGGAFSAGAAENDDGEEAGDEAEKEDDSASAAVRAMTSARYDAMTPGEADFSLGLDRLAALKGEAGFPLLSVNALDEQGARLFSGSIIVEKDGLRIGVFGLTGPLDIEGVTVSDAGEAARSAVGALRGEGCDVVIALACLGAEEDGASAAAALADAVEGLDIVIDMTADAPDGGLWTDDGALIASAGAGLERIGIVAIDPSGRCAALAMDESWF